MDKIKLMQRYEDLLELINYNTGILVYPCKQCGDDTEVDYDVEDFDPDMHYCGKSPSCCP